MYGLELCTYTNGLNSMHTTELLKNIYSYFVRFHTVFSTSLPISEVWMLDVEVQMPNVECQGPNVRCRVSRAECRRPSTECQIPSVECRIPSAKCRTMRVEL